MVKCLVYKNIEKNELTNSQTYHGYIDIGGERYVKLNVMWNEKFNCFQDIDKPSALGSLYSYEDFAIITSIFNEKKIMDVDY